MTDIQHTDLAHDLEALRATVEAQQARIAQLEADRTNDDTGGQQSSLSRRALFGLAGAGVAGAALGSTASPAAAATGGNFVLGQANDADATTSLASSADAHGLAVLSTATGDGSAAGRFEGVGGAGGINVSTNAGRTIIASAFGPNVVMTAVCENTTSPNAVISAEQKGLGVGVQGLQQNALSTNPGLKGMTDGTGAGVHGVGAIGVHAESTASSNGKGVYARSSGGGSIGVDGEGNIGILGRGALEGVRGLTTDGIALFANETGAGTGLFASTDGGVAGHFRPVSGVHLHLEPFSGATAAGAPTTGTHSTGMVFVDSEGDLFLCTAAGTPGTWVKLNGQTDDIAQGPAFLSEPERAYDSRSTKGGPGPFASGETRTIDLTTNTDFTAGASGALINLTVVNTNSPNGFVSAYAGNVTLTAAPTFSNINWFGEGQILANTTATAVSTSGKIKVYSSGPADVLVDVIASYA